MAKQRFQNIDSGRDIDWGKTSQDYDRYRPGPPDSFYRKLRALDIGLPGQRILDLATGTGLLARRFAEQGSQLTGIDISDAQIEMARAAATRESLDIEFDVGAVEALSYADQTFDVVTANQCWLYFDLSRVIPEIRRVLKPSGQILISHFTFMPRLDEVARASEALVLKYNPDWSGADWDGYIAPQPAWSRDEFDLLGFFVYDEQIPFTRESWRGRLRALRGIAAHLSAEEVTAFDKEHEVLLSSIAPVEFRVWHRLHAHIFRPTLG